MKAANNLRDQSENVFIWNIFVQDCEKCVLVNRSKKLSNIALQHPSGSGMILRYFVTRCQVYTSLYLRYYICMKITKSQIAKSSKKVSTMMHDLRKRFFELEVLQSVMEAQAGKVKKYSSANMLISEIGKGL